MNFRLLNQIEKNGRHRILKRETTRPASRVLQHCKNKSAGSGNVRKEAGNPNPCRGLKNLPDLKKRNKVLAVIPARGGSKGIPGKNVKRFAHCLGLFKFC